MKSGGTERDFRVLRGKTQTSTFGVKTPNVFDNRRWARSGYQRIVIPAGIVPRLIHLAAVDFDTPQALAAYRTVQ